MKDYAKTHQSKLKHPTRRRRNLITAVIILVAAGLPLSMYYIQYRQVIHNKGRLPAGQKTKMMTAKTTTLVKPKQEDDADSAMQFDFYTLLPKMQSETAQVSHQQTAYPVPPTATHDSPYVLQIASSRNLAEAKRLRSQIAELGFSAFIQHYQAKNQTWYRVIVGPYPSLAQAQTAQTHLTQQQIDSLLLKLKTK